MINHLWQRPARPRLHELWWRRAARKVLRAPGRPRLRLLDRLGHDHVPRHTATIRRAQLHRVPLQPYESVQGNHFVR